MAERPALSIRIVRSFNAAGEAVCIGGLAAIGAALRASECLAEMTRKDKMNLAVIGAGYWGANLVSVFRQLGALYRICDLSTRLQSKTDGADAWGVLKVLEASQRSLSMNGEPVQLQPYRSLEVVDA
jgi:pyruvate/2-oxoglutarate dehydrogenase complex dihydrolipoamide dehydrogenase (E3) component